MRLVRRVLVVAGLAVAALAAVPGPLHGVVHDPQHRPVPGVHLHLQSVVASNTEAWTANTLTNAVGEFTFPGVPPGTYIVTAHQPGFAPLRQVIEVGLGAHPVVHLQLSLASSTQVTTVTAAADTVASVASTSTPTTLVSHSAIVNTPGADRPDSMAAITDFVPGAYMVHDQLHVRGGHQVSWLIDGVPVPNTSIGSNVGPQFNPQDMAELDVQRGSYSAAYGDRTYGVFDVIPRTGFSRNNQGEILVTGGSFGQTNDQINFGSHNANFAYYASLSGNRSSLGLETPQAEILHDATNGQGAFQSLIDNLGANDQLRFVGSERHDFFQIPNTVAQNAAGMHDAQVESDDLGTFSWVHTFNPGAVMTLSPFYHYNTANYEGAPTDQPISTTDLRSSMYVGGQATLDLSRGDNTLELGAYGFHEHDNQNFILLFNDGSHPNIHQPTQIGGGLIDVFAQGKVKPEPWLTLMAGVRQSHFSGGLTEDATSPRLGMAVVLPVLNIVLRGNYSRYYQAPPLLTASGPVLQYVTSNSLGFLPLHGERDEEWQVGFDMPLSGWTLDADYFHIRARNFFDHNSVGNSDVYFPLTISAARIYGFESTVRSPLLWGRTQFHGAYSNQIVEGAGQVTGGLTDFSPPSGWFLLDHDQRNTFSGGMTLTLPGGTYFDGELMFGSGFANGNAPPAHLPGHVELNATLGHEFSDTLSADITVLNLTNRHLLTDNSVTFGGTHFNNPRQIYGELRYKFSY